MAANILSVLDQRFRDAGESEALISRGQAFSFTALRQEIENWGQRLSEAGIDAGSVVVLRGDFSVSAISALFALIHRQAISILLAPTSFEKQAEFSSLGRAAYVVDSVTGEISGLSGDQDHVLYDSLRAEKEAGIILFSSGSTGTSKGTVHNAQRLLGKFQAPGKSLRTLAFLLFDHIAGLDTLFYCLANTSTLVLPNERTPENICRLIDKHQIEVLPTAPSFLNLLLLSGALERNDLSSLRIITYGSEMMPPATLERLAAALPHVRLIQKYGTSETGAMPSQSRSNTSTWVRLGGNGFEWRVRKGMFEVRAQTTMLGYLNAPSPFTDDGWFQTGDRVETDGEYIRFLGRESDIINVGGQKVYPAEIEALLLAIDGIADAAVYGEQHAILGAAIVAKIQTDDTRAPAEIRACIRQSLKGQVESYKIPQKILITREPLTSARFKTIRKFTTRAPGAFNESKAIPDPPEL